MGRFKKVLSLVLVFVFVVSAFATSGSEEVFADGKYMTRFRRLEAQCKQNYKYNGNQMEMMWESADEYGFWDKELNVVYSKELRAIKKKKAKKLKKLQKAWKKKRVKYAEKQTADFIGSSMYTVEYNMVLIKYTKKRIKWLIKNYKDVGDFQ